MMTFSRSTIRAMVALSFAALAALPGAALAQSAAAAGSAQRGAAAPNYIRELATIADAQGRRLQARIVIDPLCEVPLRARTVSDTLDADATMEALVAQITHGTWRRIYLPNVAGAEPAPAKIAAIVRSLETLEQSGVVLEDPKTQKITSFLKNVPVPANIEEVLQQQRFSPTPTYFLTRTQTEATRADVPRVVDLQRQLAQAMAQMTPDEAAQAMSGGMQWIMNMDPSSRAQMVQGWMMGIRSVMQNMSPMQRQQLYGEMQRYSAPVPIGLGGMRRRGGAAP